MKRSDRSGDNHTSSDSTGDHPQGTELDRFFDGELSREQTAAMLDRLRSDPARMRRFGATQGVVERLREPLQHPDLTDRILHEAEERGAFRRPPFWRRHARTGGLGFAAALAMAVGAWVLFAGLGGGNGTTGVGPGTLTDRDTGPALLLPDEAVPGHPSIHPDLVWEPGVKIDKEMGGQDLAPRLTLEDGEVPDWLRLPSTEHAHDGAGHLPPGRLLIPGSVDQWRIGPTERAFLKSSRERKDRDEQEDGGR